MCRRSSKLELPAVGLWRLAEPLRCLLSSVAVNGFNGCTCYSPLTVSSRLSVTSGCFQLRLAAPRTWISTPHTLIAFQITRPVLPRQELANGELSRTPGLLRQNPERSCGTAGSAAAGPDRRRRGVGGADGRSDGGAAALAVPTAAQRQRRSDGKRTGAARSNAWNQPARSNAWNARSWSLRAHPTSLILPFCGNASSAYPNLMDDQGASWQTGAF